MSGRTVWQGPSEINGAPIVAILTGLDSARSHNPKTGAMAQLWILPADVAPSVAVHTGADASVCGDCPLRPIMGGRYRAGLAAAETAAGSGWRTFRVAAPDDSPRRAEIRCPASKEAGNVTTCARCGLCDGSKGPSDRRKLIMIADHGHGRCYVKAFQAPGSVWRAWKRGSYQSMTETDYAALQGVSVRLGAYGDPAALPFDVVARLASAARRHTGYTHQWRNCDPRFQSLLMASV